MTEKKVIAVVGATGAQGGGLVRAILAAPELGFTARALTRDAKSEKALALAKQGVEVVEANLDDQASLEKAFAGAHGVFCVTNFWKHFSTEKELAQAGAMAKAAKAAGVKHAIWSTLEDTRKFIALEDERMPTLQGKYKVPHFDAKGEADELFRAEKVPTTFLRTSLFWENFLGAGMAPKKGPDGTYSITFPMADKKLAGISSADIGVCALAIFARGDELVGKTIGIAGEHLPVAEMAATLSKELGVEVVYNYVPPEIFRTFGFPGADDLGNMFQFYRDFDGPFCEARDVAFTRTLHPKLQDFAAWVHANRANIPLS